METVDATLNRTSSSGKNKIIYELIHLKELKNNRKLKHLTLKYLQPKMRNVKFN